MAATPQAIDNLPLSPTGTRRAAMWVAAPFPATIRGSDTTGERFEVAAVLDTLSTGGLSVRLGRSVEPGAAMFAVVRLSATPDIAAPAAHVAVRGQVVRVERQPDGRYGVVVAFTRHRFLYTREPIVK
jgi:hypothetical protein